jgi:hypothetical protein
LANKVLCVDLGCVNDWTAFTLIEQVFVPVRRDVGPPDLVPEFHCGYIDRPDLGTSYPEIVRLTRRRMDALGSDVDLVVDATGVGRGPVDMMIEVGLSPIGVVLTSGDSERRTDEFFWHVPKRSIISSMQVMLQNRRFKVRRGMPLADVGLQELRDYRIQVTKSKNETYAARQGKHDDIVCSWCLGAWRCKRMEEGAPVEPPPRPGSPEWVEGERKRMRAAAEARAELEAGGVDSEHYVDSGLDQW